MDRFWLLTWRTYGTWLPGDVRGSVTRVRQGSGRRVEHDAWGTLMGGPMPALEATAREAMNGEPILLTEEQAEAVAEQFKETARHRGWKILACAVMCNHIHIVLAVGGDPKVEKLLGDLKAWGTRRLNKGWGERPNGTWWAEHGSKRRLPNDASVNGAIAYVAQQPGALQKWVAEGWAV